MFWLGFICGFVVGIIALVMFCVIYNPKDEITDEEIEDFVNYTLEKKKGDKK